ncbi:MAG: dTDP-4-dehydrorhamnose 3,5-epimerase family protein [Acidimicrobiales bacterium]
MPTFDRSTEIADVVVVDMDVHGDQRGTFVETYRKEWFPGAPEMVQTNRSDKAAGSLTGLHYHLRQADFWYALAGTARIVLHDLRRTSPTKATTVMLELTGTSHRGVYVPPGVAHGFAAHTDFVLWYFVDGYYNPDDEHGVAWDDPDLAIDWGIEHPVVSGRDASNPRLADIAEDRLP